MYQINEVTEKASGKTQYGPWTLYVIVLQNDEGQTLECSYFQSKKAPILTAGMALESCDLIKGKKADYPDAYTLEKPVCCSPNGQPMPTTETNNFAPPAKSNAGTFSTPSKGASSAKFEDADVMVPPSKANFVVAYVKDIYVAMIAAGHIDTLNNDTFINIAGDVKLLIAELNKKEVAEPVEEKPQAPIAEPVVPPTVQAPAPIEVPPPVQAPVAPPVEVDPFAAVQEPECPFDV